MIESLEDDMLFDDIISNSNIDIYLVFFISIIDIIFSLVSL